MPWQYLSGSVEICHKRFQHFESSNSTRKTPTMRDCYGMNIITAQIQWGTALHFAM